MAEDFSWGGAATSLIGGVSDFLVNRDRAEADAAIAQAQANAQAGNQALAFNSQVIQSVLAQRSSQQMVIIIALALVAVIMLKRD